MKGIPAMSAYPSIPETENTGGNPLCAQRYYYDREPFCF